MPFVSFDAGDACGGVDVIQIPAEGTELELGHHPVVLVAMDDAGNTTSVETTVLVVDVTAPNIVGIQAPAAPVEMGSQIDVLAVVNENCSIAVAEFDWGDGNQSLGTVDASLGAVMGVHHYLIPGVYTVTLVVADAAGNTNQSSFEYVVVYDSYGGFVTGGGQFESPSGAYALDASVTGRANFGFVAKYKKGRSFPSGQTHFRFQAADFSFEATLYDWLVVAGANAKHKGIGTINGEGEFSFMVTARDGGLLGVSGGGFRDVFRRLRIGSKISWFSSLRNRIPLDVSS